MDLKRFQMMAAIGAMFLGPVIASLSAYYSFQIKMTEEISSLRLEREREFVKKGEFAAVSAKLDVLIGDVRELKTITLRKRFAENATYLEGSLNPLALNVSNANLYK
jgi:hypothetical protein